MEPPELPLEDELELDEELLLDDEDDEDEVDEPPVDEVEVELMPPVEVLVEPPLVEVEPPLVLVELPPVEVELPPVEVEPPLVDVEPPVLVEETTIWPPPPPLPPKKPPKKPPPPPQPPLPPATRIGPPLPPDMLGISPIGRSIGIGAPCECTVMTVGAAFVTVLTTLRTFTGLRCTVLATGAIGLRFTWLTTAGRDVSASWRAPPPMIAPPHAQAQSFAKAIRTDMFAHSSEL